MTSVPDLPRPDQGEEIARLLHTTATTVHQQRPHLLAEACLTWLQSTPIDAQTTKIQALLAHHSDQSSLLQAVEQILGKLFTPAFKASKAHGQVLQRVQQILTPDPQSVTSLPQESPPEEKQNNPNLLLAQESQVSHSIEEQRVSPVLSLVPTIDPGVPWSGLLLVDAENMHPPTALEAHLQTLGQYPIRYRLAFGNWRTLGGRDQEFYQRGYQMIHVPSGKNSADIKMSLDASLISLHHPSIREVFICSADSDLLHLGHALLRQGMTPYRVSHDQQGFKVFNLAEQTTHSFSLPSDAPDDNGLGASFKTTTQTSENSVIPNLPSSLKQMKGWLTILLRQEYQAHPGQPVTIGRLGALFRERNHVSANQVLQTYEGYATLKQFLEADSSFELTPLPDGNSIQVELRPPTAEAAKSSPPSSTPPISVPITNIQTLEQAVVSIVKSLISQPQETIHLTALGSTFAEVYHQPMSQVLKQIGEPKGLPKFLAKCSSIRLQKQGKNWQVGLNQQT